MGMSDIGYSIAAGQDLRTHQYKAVNVGGTVAATSKAAFGLLTNKPNNGEDASLQSFGVMRYRSGGAVTSGSPVAVTTSGWIVVATSGDSAVGKAMEGISSGSIGEGIFNFATPANPL